MQGNNTIIKLLNELLTEELSSADQYFIHSQMYTNWGYAKIGARMEHERQEEIGHATKLIERILFLEGIPDVAPRNKLAIGRNVPEMIHNDLLAEYQSAASLKKVIAECEKAYDYITRDILMVLLDDTERDHAHWLEQQERLIQSLGLENYLQTLM